MTNTFSTDEKKAMERSLDVDSVRLLGEKEEEYFSVAETIDFVQKRGLTRVALQFPDELLPFSFRVEAKLAAVCKSTTFYILADTSYGSTSVDFIAAEHVQADGIVHYGDAVIGSTAEVPVLYVFQKRPIQAEKLVKAVEAEVGVDESVIFVLHSSYLHALRSIEKEVEKRHNWRVARPPRMKRGFNSAVLVEERPVPVQVRTEEGNGEGSAVASSAPLHLHGGPRSEGGGGEEERKEGEGGDKHSENMLRIAGGSQVLLPSCLDESGQGMDVTARAAKYAFAYVGVKGPQLTNLVLTMSQSAVYLVDPSTAEGEGREGGEEGSEVGEYVVEKQGVRVNQDIYKRFFLVQKVKDADVFGIVITSFGLERYRDAVERCKQLIENAKRKHYVFVVGKLNEAKLGNFPEVDVFVLIASPQDSLINTRDYASPVVTAFELEMGLNPNKEWTGSFNPDYIELLDDKLPTEGEGAGGDEGEEETHFSLVSGKVRDLRAPHHVSDLSAAVAAARLGEKGEGEGDTEGSSTALTTTEEGGAVIALSDFETPASAFYKQREYRGLEARVGETEVGGIVQGRRGIASAYDTNYLQREEESSGDEAEEEQRGGEGMDW
uniref:Diphthamide biosynthesis protein 2 n=1 Tax=Palpitomonas bilix TaxID=652834 RepID=A0A7S3D456_9EUKA|mmetsp:Transcript_20659/g.53139  ORF Transcript_20659/g.53139 Transcript_20659/m.53139 type:complete len:607 (+) Transcript_20659:80-1900(+)